MEGSTGRLGKGRAAAIRKNAGALPAPEERGRLKEKCLLAVGLLALAAACASPAQGSLPAGETFTNSLGMRFVRIEPGTFTMGETRQPLPEELFLPLSYPTTEELRSRFPQGDPARFLVHLDHVRNGDFDEQPAHRVTLRRP